MALKEKTIAKVQEDVATDDVLAELPAEIEGLTLARLGREVDDRWELFNYTNAPQHLGFCAYYHQETDEYKVRVWRGLTEFCLMDFFAADYGNFVAKLRAGLVQAITDLVVYNPHKMSYVTSSLKITDWDYQALLPEELEGFRMFITPKEPFRVLNGSYIVVDYSDFQLKSNFIIYYNEFRCEFFGEAKIKEIPEMNYVFDSRTLPELEVKLQEHLRERLQEIRRRSQS